jgi:hypothetical protein
MDKTFLAAGLALARFRLPRLGSGDRAARGPACYVEVAKLMAEPPAGIGELGAAIRELDVKLRPQVEEINALKAEIARLERARPRRRAPPARRPKGSATRRRAGRRAAPRPIAPPSGSTPPSRARGQAEPAQARLCRAAARARRPGAGARRASARRLSPPSAAARAQDGPRARPRSARPAGSQNVTGEFVTWYLATRARAA